MRAKAAFFKTGQRGRFKSKLFNINAVKVLVQHPQDYLLPMSRREDAYAKINLPPSLENRFEPPVLRQTMLGNVKV